MLQTLTTRKQQTVVIRGLRRDPEFPGRLWLAVATISTGPDSQNQSVIPWVSLCTRVHQVYRWYLLAPGTNIAHHLVSLETFTCFEMCSCLKTVFMTVMTVMRQFVKFSVLQFIFYNHCDVIKVVSLSRGSYPQYQAPGAHRSRLHSMAISWELGATMGAW